MMMSGGLLSNPLASFCSGKDHTVRLSPLWFLYLRSKLFDSFFFGSSTTFGNVCLSVLYVINYVFFFLIKNIGHSTDNCFLIFKKLNFIRGF